MATRLKIRKLIKEFYEIARARFKNAFGTYLHEVDVKDEKNIPIKHYQAMVVAVEDKKSGKRRILLPYLAPKSFVGQVKEIWNIMFPHIDSYHKRLLHEYAEVFCSTMNFSSPLLLKRNILKQIERISVAAS